MFRNKKIKGFTLVELLVVIAIIGLLASIVLVSLNTARAKARDSRRLSDWHQITLAMELYADSNNGYYPPVTAVGCSVANWTNILTPALQTGGYISQLPFDPRNVSPYQYWYGANNTANATEYILKGQLEQNTTPVAPDVEGNPVTGFGTCVCDDPVYCIQP